MNLEGCVSVLTTFPSKIPVRIMQFLHLQKCVRECIRHEVISKLVHTTNLLVSKIMVYVIVVIKIIVVVVVLIIIITTSEAFDAAVDEIGQT